MAFSERERFALSHRDTQGSTWIELGESYRGYRLEAFEREEGRIVLSRGAEKLRLSLKAATTVSGPGQPVPATPASTIDWLRWREDQAKAKAAKDNFNAGQLTEAGRLARELLAADRQPNGPGRPLHDAHMVLGRIALKEGNVGDAIERLHAAARDNPGDPGMNSFGPNMSLANDLLEHGEREAVLQYFELCRRFWRSGHAHLDEWTATIKSGARPKFGPNLRY